MLSFTLNRLNIMFLASYYGERTYVSRYLCSPVPMFPGAYVPRYRCSPNLCSPVPMFPEPMFPGAYVPRYRCSPNLCSLVPMFPGTYVPRYRCSPNLCSLVPMFPGTDVPRTYVPWCMFPGAYVPRYRCSPVPMFPGFCTLIVVISINRLQILPTPWYDSRLGLCLGFWLGLELG